ncbi:DUF1850 domain-containing protein [Oceaniglobus ichthyenteri]|uniref:DUF1850 domain-containing protein n=1 Tax=Oceaniglobus ichthyenteri TaxID=2136177 RepID=UPI000D3535D4|nr:DUF1850 domain-containing protein [Oceaniglobus ichthyenteri]
MVGATMLMLAASDFQLGWTHSVEHVEWQEEWRILDSALSLTMARVRGSGAGMEPGENARLRDGWWEWPGAIQVPALVLAASGATGAGWTLCAADTCTVIGETSGAPIIIKPCAAS